MFEKELIGEILGVFVLKFRVLWDTVTAPPSKLSGSFLGMGPTKNLPPKVRLFRSSISHRRRTFDENSFLVQLFDITEFYTITYCFLLLSFRH